jgi:hemoglobin
MESGHASLYDQLGGEAAIMAAVEVFYQKVLGDSTVAHFFTAIPMETQSNKMVGFMAWALGGPVEYRGRDLRLAHSGLVRDQRLSDLHFDAVAGHLRSALEELSIEEPLIEQVLQTVGGLRREVLGR